MKAVVVTKYGSAKDALEYREDFPVPGAADLKKSQVLVRVRAASVNPIDWKLRNGDFSFIFKAYFPTVMGKDGAGVVVATGSSVTNFAIGDSVHGWCSAGTGSHHGTYAQFAVFDESELTKKAESLSFLQAAALPIACITPFQMFKRYKGGLESPKSVLIHGASGGTGSFAVLLAKHYFNCERVFAVCSARNAEYVRSLGADRVIDYTSENFVDVIKKEQPSGLVDLVLDCVGSREITSGSRPLCNHFVSISSPPDQGMISFFIGVAGKKIASWFGACKYDFFSAHFDATQMSTLDQWLEQNQELLGLVRLNEFELKDLVKAHEASESHRTVGKIVINVPE